MIFWKLLSIPDEVTPFKNEVTEQTYLRVFQEIFSVAEAAAVYSVGTRVLGVILRSGHTGMAAQQSAAERPPSKQASELAKIL